MPASEFADDALLLVGHGSTVNTGSSLPTRQHAAELRRRGLFREVAVAFWKEEPFVGPVLGAITAGRVFVVPMFICEGYFTREIIPRELGLPAGDLGELPARRTVAAHELVYCGPVGTHERMTEVLLARVGEALQESPGPNQPPPSQIALFIAGHGTERNANSRKGVERQVELIRARQLFAEVHAVFLEEDPRIGEWTAISRSRHAALVPFFISDGMHVMEDIPVLLGESEALVKQRLATGQRTWRNPIERDGRHIWYAPGVGTEPDLVEVILDQVRDAVALLEPARLAPRR